MFNAKIKIRNKNNCLRWFYAFVVGYFVYLFVRYFLDQSYFNPIFYGINIGIHEAGHFVIFRFFGDFVMVLGGSLMECLAPLLAMITFYHQKDLFAISFCFGWLATALFDTANYIADAQEMAMPLLFGEHDWNYLLTKLGLLQYDDAIATVVRIFAMFSLIICILSGCYIVRQMFRFEEKNK